MKKPWLVAVVTTAALMITACSSSEQAATTDPAPTETTTAVSTSTTTEETTVAASEDTRIFTDSSGREVEVPVDIERVASGGPLANIMLYAVEPDSIVGWSSRPADSAKPFIEEEYWNLPEYGKFYDNQGDFNREALLSSNPDIIIDVGQWDEEYKQDVDALQEQVGIPVVIIDGNLENNPEAFRMVGDLLGQEERGNELGDYAQELLDDAAENAAHVTEHKTVYIAEDEDGLSTILADTIHSQVLEYVGAEVVATEDVANAQQGGGQVSMEQILAWDPDVILFGRGADREQLTADPTWQGLTAVQNGEVFDVPQVPYNWLTRPPGPNRLIGLPWVGNLLYPESFDVTIEDEVREFFSKMYRYELSDEELASLLENSTR